MISRISNRVSQSGANHEKAFIRTVLRIGREFGYLPEQILAIPIPQYMAIVENINDMDMKRKDGK